MIRFDDVAVTFEGREQPVLRDADLTIGEGDFVVVVGPTGSGKSTFLHCINGLVPHFSGGTLHGRVTVAGRDTATHRPRDLAEVVGFVGQDPRGSFVTDTVEEELAYGMEVLGVPTPAMRRRLEDTLDLLGLHEVRDRHVATLSGGQAQRVQVGAVLAAGPRVLVLDEPTSALDPVSAEDVLSALDRLVNDLGLTVVLAEHRLERVVHHADGVVLVRDGQVSPLLDPAAAMAHSPVFPPVVALGRALGWSPLPLSVRDARRAARPLLAALPDPPPMAGADELRPVGTDAAGTVVTATATALAATRPDPARTGEPDLDRTGEREPRRGIRRLLRLHSTERPMTAAGRGLTVDGLSVVRGDVVALRDVTLAVPPGRVTALMGRNGSGKSTLLSVLVAQLSPTTGTARVGGLDPAELPVRDLVRVVGLVPQDHGSLLYADSVAAECRDADRDFGAPDGTTRATLARIAGPVADDTHPRDLSEGQRLCLALAIILAGQPQVLLLDEPTRGLDYAAKARLVDILRSVRAEGRTVLVATHDVELAAEVADDVVLLAQGELIATGGARSVLCASPAFAPQVAKVVHPRSLLTVGEVTQALAGHSAPTGGAP